MTSMATVTLEEKRLKALKQQLFGKSDSTSFKFDPKSATSIQGSAAHSTSTTTLESVNLKSDLMKIIILSFLAMAIQLSLFFAHQHGLIKF